MLASNNFLSPANGEAIISPTQDIVLGCYYITTNNFKITLNNNSYFFNNEPYFKLDKSLITWKNIINQELS